jgi:methylated-DNA-[protein]-cysteine S-methyltransferase
MERLRIAHEAWELTRCRLAAFLTARHPALGPEDIQRLVARRFLGDAGVTEARPDRLVLGRLATPLGETLLASDERGRLRALDWHDQEPRMRRLLQRHYGPEIALDAGRAPRAVTEAIDAYFAGELARLADIDCATGGTPFQRAVWAALRGIPPGQTLSYGALAARLGHPGAARAVGHANGANPISVVIPCHRLIGARGALTGYAGGVDRKRWLLAHEALSLAA